MDRVHEVVEGSLTCESVKPISHGTIETLTGINAHYMGDNHHIIWSRREVKTKKLTEIGDD